MAAEDNLPNQEIIDATQDAVLNAVGSVANVIETTAGEFGVHEAEPFYQSAEFWVAVSFVLAVVLLVRPVVRILHKLLRKRGSAIARRLEEASKVQLQAQQMLADYERKYRNVSKEAAEILTRAEREVTLIKKDKLAKLEADMANREREAKARIIATQDEAAKELTQKAAENTIKTVKKVLQTKLDGKQQAQLIDTSIAKIAKLK